MRSHKGHMHYPTALVGSLLWYTGLAVLGFEFGWLRDIITYTPDAWMHARIMCVGLVLFGGGLAFAAAACRTNDPKMGFVWIGIIIAVLGPIITLTHYAMTRIHF